MHFYEHSGPRNLPSFGDRESDVRMTFLAPVYWDAMNQGSRVWKGGCSAYPDLAGQTLGTIQLVLVEAIEFYQSLLEEGSHDYVSETGCS